jgi:hypothetical protein
LRLHFSDPEAPKHVIQIRRITIHNTECECLTVRRLSILQSKIRLSKAIKKQYKMTAPTVTPLLDHLVILVPHSLLTSPPAWFANLFTFYPGGRHADGLTENTLVLFADGSYIEFIAFMPGIDPEDRARHRWGKQKEGTIIDWALTLPETTHGKPLDQEKVFKDIQSAIEGTGTGITYGDLVPGGRHRPDGKELKWAVASAYESDGSERTATQPGLLPFWCLDDSKRELRVPYLQDGVADHPTGVVGVALVSVTPDDPAKAEKLDKVYDALLGEESSSDDSLWDIRTIAGKDFHPDGQVRLEAVGNLSRVSLTLFTNSDKYEGTKIGGNITENVRLEFELVSAK